MSAEKKTQDAKGNMSVIQKIDVSQLQHKGDTVVGNDVWFGRESVIMPGVKTAENRFACCKNFVENS